MKVAIIVFALLMMCIFVGDIYQLRVLQNKVSCLQEQVEEECYLARHNVLIQNHNKRLNDKNIEIINENFKRIEKHLPCVYGHVQ
mgnify:CR=1 FL=1